MADPLSTAVSGLLSYQRALATVSHNIANVNTEGYSRQRVEFAPRPAELTGAGFIGNGVSTVSITRVYDEFLSKQLISNTSSFNQVDKFVEFSSQIDDLLADENIGLSQSIGRFFDATQDMADDPSSLTAREAMLSEAESLVININYINDRISSLEDFATTEIRTSVDEINALASNIAATNREIALLSGSSDGQQPNDLLDRRDYLVRQLAERVAVDTFVQDDGALNVFIGTGQALVIGEDVQSLTVVADEFNPARVEVAYQTNSSNTNIITNLLNGGSLGGVLNFRAQIIDTAHAAVGRVATGLATDFNAQHALGQDLDGVLGEDFFNISAPLVAPSSKNSVLTGVSATVTDVNQLVDSDYELIYDGSNLYTLTRLSDGTQTQIDTGGAYPFTSTAIDGFTVGINAALTTGDRFRIHPTHPLSNSISVAVTDARKIAAAVPVRTLNSISNTGDAQVDAGIVTNSTTYAANVDTYTVRMADNANAVADGINDGVIVDDDTVPELANTLEYQLSINGVQVYTQAEGDPVLADLDALAAEINDDVATTGVRAYVDAVNDRMYFVNEPPTASPITVTETLADVTGVPVAIDVEDSVVGYFGNTLVGDDVATSVSVVTTFDQPANDYIITDSANNTEASGTYTSSNNITFNGIQVSISGNANLGDQFTIEPNAGGVSDNRNVLLLASLQSENNLSNGSATYQEAYGALVANIGIQTRQAGITRDAQQVILNQAIDAQQAVSGVNLEEEAANMLRFQQAYQAVAQIISTTDNLFQVLIGAIQR